MKQEAMKSFFGWCFVKTNEGRLTLELMYALAPAFLQFPPPHKWDPNKALLRDNGG